MTTAPARLGLRRPADAARPRWLVARFALSGLVVMVGVGLIDTLVLRHAGVAEATRDARTVTGIIARSAIQPALRDALLDGSPAAQRHLDRVVRKTVLRDPLRRIKLWTPGGRIVYSDEPRLIGRRFALGSDERAVLRSGGVAAQLSDLSHPENRFERGSHPLLEVYLRVRTPNGRPLLLESYQRYSSVAQGGRRIWANFAPALAAALLMLWLLQLPFALSLARRLRRAQREREALLIQAIRASDQERQRIAADLHDGVVQDLAGITFGLGAAATRVDRSTAPELSAALRRAAEGTRSCMRRLRSLLVDIHPPTLHAAGLAPTVEDLAAPLRASGVTVECDVDGAGGAPAVEDLLFRTAREGLRNVAEHARADHVRVTIAPAGERIVLTIEDDGCGFSSEELARRRGEGHVGLRLLADRAKDLGGSLHVDSPAREGTTLRLEVPTT